MTFAIGETEKTVTVALLDDDIDEAHETFNLVLSSPVAATLRDDTATGTILDDELATAVIFSGASDNVEEGESLSYRVKRLPLLNPGETVSADDPCFTGPSSACFNFNPTADDVPGALAINLRVTEQGDVISGTAPATVTFQPGSAFATFEIATVDDSTIEADAVITVQVLNGSGYSPLYVGVAQSPDDALPTATRTVYDNDLTFSIADSSATEGTDTTVDFTVSLNAPAPQEVTISVATADGDATSHGNITRNDLGRDFTAKTETITFAQGDQTKTFSVAIEDDTTYEVAETFTARLSNPPPYKGLADDTATGTIIDNEEAMVASVYRTYNIVNERHPGPLVFAVALSHQTTTNHERNPAVAWQVMDGTATGGEDYLGESGTVRFGPGEIIGFIELGVIDDNLIEAELETFTVELLDTGSRLVSLSPTSASYETFIRDNETLTASEVANSQNVVEGQDAAFTVYLTGGATTVDTMVTFELSESDASETYVDTSDYGTPIGNLSLPTGDDSGRSGTLTIPAGEFSGTITYPIAEDSEKEEDGELMELRIFTVSDDLKGGSVSSTQYKDSSMILDKDSLTVSIEGTPTVAEGGTATFTVTLSSATDESVLVGWATKQAGDTLGLGETAEPGSDYTADSSNVTIAVGDTSATFTVDTTDDTLVEDTEYFVVTLEEATKGSGLLPEMVPLGAYFATGTITDNDTAPDSLTVTVTPDWVNEGDGVIDLSVTVSLDGTSQFTTDTPVSLEIVARTATIDEDFTAEGVDLVIPAGESSVAATIPFTVLDDDVLEVNERVLLRASSRALANQGEARVVIEDNDLAPGMVMLTIAPTEADESAGTVSIRVNAEMDGGTIFPKDVEIDLATSDGTATAGEDYETGAATLTLPAGERNATGTLEITVLDDTLDEADKTLMVTGTVTNLNALNLNGGLPVDSAEFTIRDNDAAPTSIDLSVTGDAINEGGGTATLTVRATLLGGGTRLEDTTVTFAEVPITATLFDDYTTGGPNPVITIPAGNFYAETTLTVTPVQDTLYEGDETIAVRGGNLDPGIPVNGVVLTIQDDDPAPTTIALSIDPGTLSEMVGSSYADVTATIEGNSTFTEDTQVRVMLDHENTRVRSTPFSAVDIPAGQMSGKSKLLLTNLDDDVDDDDEILEFTGTTDNPDLTVKSGQPVVTNDDTAGISISPNTLTVTEGGQSRFYTIKLDSQPTADVTVTAEMPANAGFSIAPGSVTFTPQDWRPNSISVTATDDEDITDEPAATITHTISSNDTLYRNAAPGSVSVTVRDDDEEEIGVTISKTSLTIEEGDSDTYTVALKSQPAGDVTVTIAGNTGTDVSLDKTELTFTDQNWETAQTITVTAEHDNDTLHEDDVTLTHTVASTADTDYDGIDADSVIVSVTDEDEYGVNISKAKLTLEEGASDTYTVVLGSQPAGDVTVTIGGNANTDVSLDKTTLTFTDQNWETAQTVTVTAEHDNDTLDEDDVTLTHTVASAADTDYDDIDADSVVVSVTDDDPSVSVEFGAGTYGVEESDDTSTTETRENEVVVTIKLSADPNRTVTIPITKTDQGGTSSSDYSGVPRQRNLQRRSITEKSFTFTATADAVDDDGESVKLTFGTMPTGVWEGTTAETVISINDDDLPADVDVEFEQSTYTVAEGSTVSVKVTLSEDPERSVTIPIIKTDQDGASSADYSGVPANVTFNAGDTEKSFTFMATADTVDDDSESVKLAFDTDNLPTGVTEGTTNETVISITDDDVPSVSVEFGAAAYSVAESDDADTTETKENEVSVTVTLSADPERTVTIPITKTDQDGATSADYSGVPASV